MSLRKSAVVIVLFATACRPDALARASAADRNGDELPIKPAIYRAEGTRISTSVQLVRYGRGYYGGYRGGYGGYGGGYRGFQGGYFPYPVYPGGGYYGGYYGGGLYSPYGYGLGLGYSSGPMGYGYPGMYGGQFYSFPSYGGYGYTYGFTPSVGIW